MQPFQSPLIPGILVRRYKRFLADIQLPSGEVVTAHCTNSGSMKSCLVEGAEVFLSPVTNPDRKTRYTWEMINIDGCWVGINTLIPSLLAYNWLQSGVIPGFVQYHRFRREVTYGDSRFDIMAENGDEKCFIEVKNVTLKEGNFARFPDARTTRGQKHLETLIQVRQNGMRAVMLYVVQRTDVTTFGPAREIDPDYSQWLRKAHQQGVEIIPFQVAVSPEGFNPVGVIDYVLDIF